MLGMVVVGG
jgi:hypothetical protein